MSKITATKFWRLNQSIGKYIVKQSEPIIRKDRHLEVCIHCKEPMAVADGQIAYFHKECRKKKRSFRNQGKDR